MDREWLYIIVAGSVFIAIFVAMLNAVYFHYRYQRELDKRVMGETYVDWGLLLNLTRLMMYGHYILFPKRAKRAGVHNIFSNLNGPVRAHLLFHWFSLIFALFGASVLGLFEVFLW